MDGGRNSIEWPSFWDLQNLGNELGLAKILLQHIEASTRLKSFVQRRATVMMEQDFTQWDIRRWDKNIPMVHPDMLWLHGKRGGKFAKLLAIILKKGNKDKAGFFGEIHDLPEYASPPGDVLSIKKQNASIRTNQILELIEQEVGQYLSEFYLPQELSSQGISRDVFAQGLKEAGEYITVESQLARLADILEGIFYPILEIREGNKSFESISKNSVNSGRLEKLKKGDLFPGLFDTVSIDFGELLDFIENPHTTTPPKLYMDWLNIWKDVQDEYACSVWSERIEGYSESILGLLYQENTVKKEENKRKLATQPSETRNYREKLLALGCSNDDIQGMTSQGEYKLVEITTHSLTGNISVRVKIGKEKLFQTFHLSPYIENGIRKMSIRKVPRLENDVHLRGAKKGIGKD